jgi:chromosome segregation ATPase
MEGLPDKLKQAEESVAAIRQSITEKRNQVLEIEEELRQNRRIREGFGDSLSDLERKFLDATYALEKLKDGLLKDYRVMLYDPEAIEISGLGENPFIKPIISSSDQAASESPNDDDSEVLQADQMDEESAEENQDAQDQTDEQDQNAEQDQTAEQDQNDEVEGLEGLNDVSPQIGIIIEDQDPLFSPEQTDEADPLGLQENPAPIDNENSSENEMIEKEPAAVLAPPEIIEARLWAEKELKPDAEAIVATLKGRLSSMGEVNLSAIEQEADLTDRYNFHKTQYEDLNGAINDLKDSINRINQTCRKRFGETFQQANQKFKDIFPVLFEGGEGWLALTNEADPLESGVEIHVHPPGKNITVMRSLSGGEKTLTSLCLIFALYLIKPSPFCLLDEADAPLDEANIDRFNRLLRNLSEASQIIMVTHNKRTMQISDTLYGVTMETPGVSRLVSVNLAEAEGLTND